MRVRVQTRSAVQLRLDLRVRGQDVGQPVLFYTQQSKTPYELVFTRVTKNTVTGYLLAPPQSAGDRESISGKTEEAYSASPEDPTRH